MPLNAVHRRRLGPVVAVVLGFLLGASSLHASRGEAFLSAGGTTREDAFNRLVSKSVGSTTEITAWAGWQPIETSEAGSVTERRTFGLGLDELVRLEIDLDEDGVLDQTYTPLYEQSGNLVAMADPAGEIIERYLYNPYGFRLAVTDSVPPEVLQLLYRSGALNVELSEEILRAVLRGETETQQQSTSGEVTAQTAASTVPPVSLVVTATGEEIPVDVSFPVELGRFAFHRAVITPTGAAPDPGTEVTLTIEAEGLEDTFFNRPAAAFSQSFTWPDPAMGTDEVLQDAAAPLVEEVLTREGHLEIAFSEEVDLGSAQAAIEIDGATAAWQLDATGYRLTSVEPLASGAQSLTIGTGVQDLTGTPLATPLTLDLTDPIATAEPAATTLGSESEGLRTAGAANTLERRTADLAAPDSVFYKLDEAVRLLTSSIGNRFGFHGRELDFATGLVYFRNRWYDPELGRFITTDPLGYVDGPNLYQYGLNNPVSFSDPMGLRTPTEEDKEVMARLEVRIEEFDAQWEGEGVATAEVLEADYEPVAWWAPGKMEKVYRWQPYDATDAESYELIRAQLQRDYDTYVSAVEEADEDGVIDYFRGTYYTTTLQERIRINRETALYLSPVIACELAAMKGGRGGRSGCSPRAMARGGRRSRRVAKPSVKKLGPDPAAEGAHTRFKREPGGRVYGYTEFDAYGNPVRRFRGTGGEHGGMKPPLVLRAKPGKGPGSRLKVPYKPEAWELPRGYLGQGNGEN